MKQLSLVTLLFFSFLQSANALDRCDGLFNDADQILKEVLNSPTACDAFSKAGLFAGDRKKISVRSERILDRDGEYDGTRYIVVMAGEHIIPTLEPTDKDPEYHLATLKFVSLVRSGKCVFNTYPLYSESKISKADYDKM